MARDDFSDSDTDLVDYARKLCAARLASYELTKHDVEEHANIEESVLAGGYAYRQVAEVIQNAADAIAEGAASGGVNRIEVVADRYGLWAANTGAPVDRAGVKALLNAHSSNKRATQIGRFGLGFKSLLRLGGRIDVLSRPVCLHFRPEETRRRIREHLSLDPDAPAPGMRLAEAGPWADGLATVEGAGRYGWATTIVFAAMESVEARQAIFREIKEFPEEFLLFLPCDVELVLAGGDTIRSLRRRTEDDGCVVIEDVADRKKVPQRWRIFENVVSISDKAAIEDATSVHYRESMPVVWACPIGAAREGGRFRERKTGLFYAFFPTTTDSRTLGILNAPWKLNHDRTALVTGAWNSALMEEAAKLIATHITDIGTVDDPGAVLDAFPRELQGSSDPATPLVRALWSRLEDAPVIPNCDGEFRRGAELSRAPADVSAIISAWAELAPPAACETHVHPTCVSTPARAGRLNTLAGRLEARTGDEGLVRTAAETWLEMAATTDVDTAGEVLRLCDSYAGQAKSYWWDSNRSSLRVILAADGTIECASNLVLGLNPQPPLRAVHRSIQTDAELKKILLQRFHVRDSASLKVTDVVDAAIAAAEDSGDWKHVWDLLRKMPLEKAISVLRRRAIRVRTLGGWGLPREVFRKGELVTDALVDSVSDGSRTDAASLVVDSAWHAEDAVLLDELGIDPNPDPFWQETAISDEPGDVTERWLAGWRDQWVERLYVHLHCRADRQQLGPAEFSMPYGWQWLLLGEGPQRQSLSHWIMECIEEADADEGEFDPVEFRHVHHFAYSSENYPHPVWSLLLERGELAQKDAVLPFSALMVDGMTARARLLPSLRSWELALSRLEDAGADRHSAIDEKEAWKQWLHYASREECEPGELSDFYEAAAAAGAVPAEVCSGSGPLPLEEISVTLSARDAEIASEAGLPAIALANAASRLWIEHGAQDLAAHRETAWDGEAEIIRLVDFEPTFAEVLVPGRKEEACVSLVSSLRQNLNGNTVPLTWLHDQGLLLVDAESFSACGWAERIGLIVEAATAVGWVSSDDALTTVLQSGPAARRRQVAEEPDLPSRLLRAIGGGDALLRLFEPDMRLRMSRDFRRAAEVALTMFGPSLLALKAVREMMTGEGLDPPAGWSGARAADFVAAIGFPPEYAVAPQRKREAELSVDGPVPMNPLHDFQQEVVTNLDGLFADKSARRRRAVISLPTGAGKTRVAAETAVTRILTTQGSNRQVLWIAQSDELCEQAVQCFRQLWANLGSEEESLRIVRFWGSQSNPKAPEHGEPVVVVATIQTLESRMGQPGTDWIRSPALVVIDECHHALTPSYTGAFGWLKGRSSDGREPPILGLSATPFRGRNVEETIALARRFDGRLFPQRQAELFDELQARGVLARFRYTKLEILERLELTEEEEVSLKRFNKLPTGAMERLGRMSDRNDRIVEAIEEAEEQSALVFATSVNHALRLAARLNLRGTSAAAVTGETDRNSRRWFIEAFRRGEIRVLINHSALTTGFDAPATDLIVIARPVFSPSLYMQMVGRGLRGPVNGGKEECRILTVQDNLDQYTDMLAHHFFEQHYVNS